MAVARVYCSQANYQRQSEFVWSPFYDPTVVATTPVLFSIISLLPSQHIVDISHFLGFFAVKNE